MATLAVAISLAVMIITVSVGKAFNENIRNKMFGFWGHIQLTNIASVPGVDERPLLKDSIFKADVSQEKWFQRYNTYALKPAIIKTKDAINGIVVKGVSDDFSWEAFEEYVIEGQVPAEKNEVLISKTIADRLDFKVGDKLRLFFIQKPPRARAPVISGIYNTNLVELDEQIVFTDISHIQKLNGWSENEVSGVEIFVDIPERSRYYADIVRNDYTDYQKLVQSLDETNPQIFDWLGIIKTPEYVILGLMTLVAIVNMASMLLVIILERTNMIGVLKAIGAPYSLIRNVFLHKAAYIILWGLLLGNLLGIGLAWIQQRFEVISLDPESYYLSVVPIHIHLPTILLLNLATILVILLALLLPSLMIKRVNPVQALRFK
ncbi:MAG: ABC transporter permease [Saprospiraceae bacterium]|nr:ABC transporter permease [Saprospiraceae bacterium]